MKILIDENMPLAERLFSSLGTVIKKPGRSITRADLLDVDALMVRSVTRVDAATLAGTPVKFVGTATIGTDHLALAELADMGVTVASAPGCNAQAVVEYVCAALMELETSRHVHWRTATVGIVGLGNVGRRLQTTLQAIGCQVIACDPLLADAGEKGLQDFRDMLNADIITFHTPLTRAGRYPTWHLADANWLQQLPPNRVLINASRGPVIDNRALSELLTERSDLSVVLDVWEDEPLLDRELAQQVDIATPHIAGYSFDGKAKGTWQVYEQFCHFLNVAVEGDWRRLVPDDHMVTLDLQSLTSESTAAAVVKRVYQILDDDVSLRATLGKPAEERAKAFDHLRKDYRLRREFSTVKFRHCDALSSWPREELLLLSALGFDFQGASACAWG